MKNTLSDLNNYLFEQIERINDDSLTDAELEREIKRSNAITKVARVIVDNGALALAAKKYMDECGEGKNCKAPFLLEGSLNEK